MLQFDLTLVLVLVSFLVFMLGMKAVFFDPVGRIKVLREQKIKLDQISTDELQQEVDMLTQRVQHQVTESRLKAQQLLTDSQALAKAQAGALVADARSQSDLARNALTGQLQAETARLQTELGERQQELVNLVMARLEHMPQRVGGLA
jgi:F0F1-type ATP synthase membrane subunit b/b'